MCLWCASGARLGQKYINGCMVPYIQARACVAFALVFTEIKLEVVRDFMLA